MIDEPALNDVGASDPQSGASYPIPPYISFSTLLTFLTELKTNGIPPQIDKSVLRRFSYGTQVQLKGALKSLRLIDDSKPTPRLAKLVEAHETPAFNDELLDLLHYNYPYVFAIDLMTATPAMFADTFKATGAKEDVARKCRTFFLYAAKQAGVPLGNRILNGTTPRPTAGSGTRRKQKSVKVKDSPPADPGVRQEHRKSDHGPDLMDRLLGKFPDFNPEWPEDMQAKWFASFQDFMKAAKGVKRPGGDKKTATEG